MLPGAAPTVYLITHGTTAAAGRAAGRTGAAPRPDAFFCREKAADGGATAGGEEGGGAACARRRLEKARRRAGGRGTSWGRTVGSPARRRSGPGRAGAQRWARPLTARGALRLAPPAHFTAVSRRAGSSRQRNRQAGRQVRGGFGRAGVGRLREAGGRAAGARAAQRLLAAAGARRAPARRGERCSPLRLVRSRGPAPSVRSGTARSGLSRRRCASSRRCAGLCPPPLGGRGRGRRGGLPAGPGCFGAARPPASARPCLPPARLPAGAQRQGQPRRAGGRGGVPGPAACMRVPQRPARRGMQDH